MFAQAAIKVDEVARELAAVQAAIGSGADVEWFVRPARGHPPGRGVRALRDTLGPPARLAARFRSRSATANVI